MTDMDAIRTDAQQRIAAAQGKHALAEVRISLFGKKAGTISALLRSMGQLTAEERPAFGQKVNNLKREIETALSAREDALSAEARAQELAAHKIDVTLPGRERHPGGVHPLSQTLHDVIDIFRRMGFTIRSGPEAELEKYNFDFLNIPADHPARDMHDTFYLKPGVVLRTHTSPVQIRTLLSEKIPLQIIVPGAVYRCDDDITHSPMFYQVEGLLVDENVTFAQLKGTLTRFAHECFGADTPMRFRPSYFPFTEPSAEVDIGCIFCGRDGSPCRVCQASGWLELLGAGMVHPQVFREVGLDPARVSGFAFGLGIERIAMLRLGVPDIRLFYQNDLRFLAKF